MANKKNRCSGLTLIEVLIVAPIIILVIGAFITAIVYLTGEVMSSRIDINQSYMIQDALNRIEQDVKLSTKYLATNSITLTSPQGYDESTAAFDNVSSGNMLILNMYGLSTLPTDATRSILYTTSPNACNSGMVDSNTPVMFNVVYFVKSNNLIRRVIAPSDYATNNCNPSTQSTVTRPWQLPSCTAGNTGGFCKLKDEILVSNISATDGFLLSYYTAGSIDSLSDASNPSVTDDATRQASLDLADMVKVTINTSTTAAGREINQSGTMRATKYN